MPHSHRIDTFPTLARLVVWGYPSRNSHRHNCTCTRCIPPGGAPAGGPRTRKKGGRQASRVRVITACGCIEHSRAYHGITGSGVRFLPRGVSGVSLTGTDEPRLHRDPSMPSGENAPKFACLASSHARPVAALCNSRRPSHIGGGRAILYLPARSCRVSSSPLFRSTRGRISTSTTARGSRAKVFSSNWRFVRSLRVYSLARPQRGLMSPAGQGNAGAATGWSGRGSRRTTV